MSSASQICVGMVHQVGVHYVVKFHEDLTPVQRLRDLRLRRPPAAVGPRRRIDNAAVRLKGRRGGVGLCPDAESVDAAITASARSTALTQGQASIYVHVDINILSQRRVQRVHIIYDIYIYMYVHMYISWDKLQGEQDIRVLAQRTSGGTDRPRYLQYIKGIIIDIIYFRLKTYVGAPTQPHPQRNKYCEYAS